MVLLKRKALTIEKPSLQSQRRNHLRIISITSSLFRFKATSNKYENLFSKLKLDEEIYMEQPEGFPKKCKEHLTFKLKIYLGSRQWYIKFNGHYFFRI